MKTSKLNAIALIAFLAIGISSCSKDDNTTTQPTTQETSIAAQVVANPNLSLLVKALTKAELVQTLSDQGTYTVFAPTNAAFEAANINAAYIDNQTTPTQIDALKQVLLNHVLATRKASTDLTTGYVKTLAKGAASTTNSLSMYVDATSGVKLNGVAVVTTPNLGASNGIIHVVDKVITLPTIVTHATANKSFETLAGLLTTQELVATLGGTSTPPAPFTVFAPLNSAFDAATLSLYGGLTSAQKTAVLKYHVVTGLNVLSNAIPTTPIPTFEGSTFTVAGTVITDELLRTINIVVVDVQCSNGVIHAVNKVLLPF